jgi:hypothetical protein
MILRFLRSHFTNYVRVHKLITVFTLHFSISHDALLGGGIISTHFFGQKHPTFFDHSKLIKGLNLVIFSLALI